MDRQNTFITNKTNRLKIGMNCIYNRFFYLNGKIDLNWLNLAYSSMIYFGCCLLCKGNTKVTPSPSLSPLPVATILEVHGAIRHDGTV